MKQPKKNSINLHRTSRTYTEVKWHRTTRTYTVLLQFVLTKTSKTLFKSSGTVVPLTCCGHETGCKASFHHFPVDNRTCPSDIQAFKKKKHAYAKNHPQATVWQQMAKKLKSTIFLDFALRRSSLHSALMRDDFIKPSRQMRPMVM